MVDQQGQFLRDFLYSYVPKMVYNGEYYEGEAMPADEGSRGKPIDAGKLEELLQKLGWTYQQ